jgi:hypothetical protein
MDLKLLTSYKWWGMGESEAGWEKELFPLTFGREIDADCSGALLLWNGELTGRNFMTFVSRDSRLRLLFFSSSSYILALLGKERESRGRWEGKRAEPRLYIEFPLPPRAPSPSSYYFLVRVK